MAEIQASEPIRVRFVHGLPFEPETGPYTWKVLEVSEFGSEAHIGSVYWEAKPHYTGTHHVWEVRGPDDRVLGGAWTQECAAAFLLDAQLDQIERVSEAWVKAHRRR